MTEYLRRKLRAVLMSGNFRGYLRSATGYPCKLSSCMAGGLVSLTIEGADGGVGDRTINLSRVTRRSTFTAPMYREYYDDGTITLTGTSENNVSVGTNPITAETDETYTFVAFFEKTTGLVACQVYDSTAENYHAAYKVYPIDSLGRVILNVAPGKDHIISFLVKVSGTVEVDYRCMAIEGTFTPDTAPTEYIPYGYQIPIVISSGDDTQTFNVYLDNPLSSGETYTVSDEDKLPVLPRGDVTITADTSVEPSSITVKYYSSEKEVI